MTEEEARAAVQNLCGGDAIVKLAGLADLVVEENERQNLIGRSTIPQMWRRHLLDSVQLLRFAPIRWRRWIDIGTGAGFPGLAIACTRDWPMVLVEPRALRAEFLSRAADALGLDHVSVIRGKIDAVSVKADVISARAVASPATLLHAARQCANAATHWLFLGGARSWSELTDLPSSGRWMFHVEQSLSEPLSAILIGKERQ